MSEDTIENAIERLHDVVQRRRVVLLGASEDERADRRVQAELRQQLRRYSFLAEAVRL